MKNNSMFVVLSIILLFFISGVSADSLSDSSDVPWEIIELDSIAVDDSFGATSVDIDSKGNIGIAYESITIGVKYGTLNNDLIWDYESISQEYTIGELSLKYLPDDTPAIVYCDESGECLKYATKDANDLWHIEIVDSIGFGYDSFCSLAILPDGSPAIAYYDQSNNDLKYAVNIDGDWYIEIVDEEGDVGEYCSLAIDSNSNPAICYYDTINEQLKFALRNIDENWSISVIDSNGDVGSYCSLAYDCSGLPGVSYYDSTNTALKYAHLNNENFWEIILVDNDGKTGYSTSLSFGPDDQPSIAYHYYEDYYNNGVSYARYISDGQWTSSFVDFDGGDYPDLILLDSGNPIIGYVGNSGDLRVAMVGISQLDVPLISQTDTRWENDQLGTGSYTIGSHGCALTSTSMVVSYYSDDVNEEIPKYLNGWLKRYNGFIDDDVIDWERAADYDSSVQYVQRYDFDPSNPDPADIALMKTEIRKGHPLVAEVRSNGLKHFVVLTGYSGDVFYINDPNDGITSTTDDPQYDTDYEDTAGGRIYGIRVYNTTGVVTKTIPDLQSPGIASPPGAEVDSLTPAFSWEDADSVDGYRLYISECDLNGEVTISCIYVNPAMVNETGEIVTNSSTIPFGILEPDHNYCWNVESKVNGLWSYKYSDPFYFTTNNVDVLQYYPADIMVGERVRLFKAVNPDIDVESTEWNFGTLNVGDYELIDTLPDDGYYSNNIVYKKPGTYTVYLNLTCTDNSVRSYHADITIAGLETGDILLARFPFHYVPGMWHHAAMYVGNNQIVESPGKGKEVEITDSLEKWYYPNRACVDVIRVTGASGDERISAANFALNQVGKKYDEFSLKTPFIGKQADGKYGWYCSELVWGAYYQATGGRIDISNSNAEYDSGGACYIVLPEDLYLSDQTEEVNFHVEDWYEDSIFSKMLSFRLDCPVDMEIQDPDGGLLKKNFSSIENSSYLTYDYNGDNVSIATFYEPKEGDYQVCVIPMDDAKPDDTFSLSSTYVDNVGNNLTSFLEESRNISEITNDPYEIQMNSKPIVLFSSESVSGTAPFEVQFIDTSINIPTSWNWTFGDGVASTEQNPIHTYQTVGTYNVTLSISNKDGTDSLTKTDYINVTPPLIVSVGIPLAPGWNMISIPVTGGELTIPPQVMNVVYTYDPTGQTYVADNVANLEPCKGYWVSATAACTLNASGNGMECYAANLSPGWNMIGSACENISFENLGAAQTGSVQNYAYSYDPQMRSYVSTNILNPCFGYWVLAREFCTLDVSMNLTG